MLRNKLEENYFLNDFLRKGLLCYNNKRVNQFIEQISKIDSIIDFNTFSDIMKNQNQKITGNTLYSIKRSYGESLLYGHLNCICEYAGIGKNEEKYFPIIEHGVDFWEQIKKLGFPRVCQGNYLKERWHLVHPNVPMFTIGPIINYAKDYYSEDKIIQLKCKLNKTVLIVPAHTHEMAKKDYDMKKFVIDIMNMYYTKYDTVMVLAYWADLKNDVYKYFEEEGAMVVSAGFRGDKYFISRLKTIFRLSDKIVGNDLGTFLGYGVALGKDVELLEYNINYKISDIEYSVEENEIYKNNSNSFFNSFGVNASDNNKIELCNKFWGIKKIMTPQQIYDIFIINKKILKESHGDVKLISKVVNNILKSNDLTNEQSDILNDAIGNR